MARERIAARDSHVGQTVERTARGCSMEVSCSKILPAFGEFFHPSPFLPASDLDLDLVVT